MASLLSIPPQVITGLSKIASLKKDQVQELGTELKKIPLKIRQHGIFDDSEFNVKSIQLSEADNIKAALFALYLGRVGGSVSVDTYVDDIVYTLQERVGKGTDWIRSEETLDRLRARLRRLLSIDSLELVAKAHNVLLEHERTFFSARVVTDIRSVFREQIEGSPSAAMIVYMLNLEFYHSGQKDKLSIALDNKDIEILMNALNRAKDKSTSLESVMSAAGITHIEVV